MIDVEGVSDNHVIVKYVGEQKPAYQTDGSAGADVCSAVDVVIMPGKSAVVPTGLKIELPPDHECQVRSRSGLAAKHGVFVLNSPGTVDCFSSDSVILTPMGKKSIFDLRINDVVFSLNEETLQIEKDVIGAILDVGERHVIRLTLDDDSELCVTPETLIYTRDGLKRASELTFDDDIIVQHDS